MNLQYYTTAEGMYVSKTGTPSYGEKNAIASDFLINGKEPQATHKRAWCFIVDENEPTKLEVLGCATRANYRWELDDTAPDAIKALTPAVITKKEACEVYDDDNGWLIPDQSPHYEYRMFYTRVSDLVPAEYEVCGVESATNLGQIQAADAQAPATTKYSVYNISGYKHKDPHQELDLTQIVRYSELSEMLVPDLLLHNQPCSLTSEASYRIIRKHVNDNIDSRWAKVTSDYDFCFTVKKKVDVKPYKRSSEGKKRNGQSYAKPRITNWTVKHKEVTLFEMTHAVRNYQNYTPIKGFKGDNLQDLIENVATYLEELMDHINAPLGECQHCQGTGHVGIEQFNSNGDRT